MSWNRLKVFIFIFSVLAVDSPADNQDFSHSLAYIEVVSSSYMQTQPWQRLSPSVSSGQAVAIGPGQLLAVASVVRNSEVIKVQPSFQTRQVNARVRIIDYDVNLCILEVETDGLSEPFRPVKFREDIKLDDRVMLAWLTKDRRYIKTAGRIENPDVRFNDRTGTGFLYYQLSTETPPGGYSEPAYIGKQVIGLVESFSPDKQISTLMPAGIINSFLRRAGASEYISVPRIGFSFVPMQDTDTRKYYRLPENEKRGVLINDVYDFGTGSGDLQRGDVLLEFGGYDIDTAGAVKDRNLGNLLFCCLFGRFETGEIKKMKLWRGGLLIEKDIRLVSFGRAELPIPYYIYDQRPEYIITGGYVLQELSCNYVSEYGDDWGASLDPLIENYMRKNFFHRLPGRDRLVVLNHILRHPVNQGYQDIQNRVLLSVNGVMVENLKHAASLLASESGSGYHVLRFEGIVADVVIPVRDILKINQDISRIYSIKELSYLNA